MSWSLYRDTVARFGSCVDVFNGKECQDIIQYAKSKTLEQGTVSGKKEHQNIRDSNILFLDSNEMRWVYERLNGPVLALNKRFFGFDLWGMTEGLQFTEYNAPTGRYDAHNDRTVMGPIRKLSIVVQLTDGNDYDGGDLQLLNAGEKFPENMDRKQGTIIAFPSFTMHRVTTVTRGTRHSLVGWVSGKPFK